MKKKVFLGLLFIVICFVSVGCEKVEESSNTDRIVLKLNTEGLGQVSYYIDEVNKMDFDDEYPNQSTYTTFENASIVSIDAKADEGWKFIMWTKDGKELSKDSKLDISVSEDTELIAVFEVE